VGGVSANDDEDHHLAGAWCFIAVIILWATLAFRAIIAIGAGSLIDSGRSSGHR
jgi:hypothetical protein